MKFSWRFVFALEIAPHRNVQYFLRGDVMGKMLIADDSKQIVTILEKYAISEGYEVVAAYDGEEALSKAKQTSFDIILLDVMMPKKDGFEVCREIRRESTVPIIMVTARGEDFEQIMGLDIGADDYIVKPFSPGQAMARVRAVLRRFSTPSNASEEVPTKRQVFSYAGLVVNLDEYITQVDGTKIILTKKETDILWTLATNKNRVFTREQLLSSLWGYEYFGDSRTVDSHIKRLRAKLDEKPHPEWEISTIRGVGYKFEVAE